ncbi:MAG: zinc ribbon domain-containing protein [Armatimonas sp.]
MKTCPDCKAPNPERLSKCYACGVRLDAHPKAAPLPGEGTYPCANCDGRIPLHMTECPHCGRVGEPPPIALEAEIPKSPLRFIEPPGWTRSDLPDGSVLLKRRLGGRLLQGGATLFGPAHPIPYIMGLLVFGISIPFARQRQSTPYSLFPGIAIVPIVIVLTLWLVWWIFGREELRMGTNWLERRVGLGSWVRTWRITDAAMVIRSRERYSRYGNEEWFDLVATGRGGSVQLATGMVPLRTAAFFGLDPGPRQIPSELTFFTEVVSNVTGWTVTTI